MRYLLYGAINSGNILYETIYSITSLIKVMGKDFDDYRVVIVTTFQKERYGVLLNYENIIIENISEDMANQWINSDGSYVFKVKIYMLKFFFDKYKENVLFVDSDTVFVDKINKIFDALESNKAIMNFKCIGVEDVVEKYNHITLNDIADQDARNRIRVYKDLSNKKKIRSFFDENKFYELPKSFYPCNSGLIGFCYEDRALLNIVLDICLSLCRDYSYACSEEFAFSIVFTICGKEILTVNDVMYHYLFEKQFRLIIGYVLGGLQEADKQKFERYIEKLNFNKEQLEKIDVSEIPYLLSYILSNQKSLKNVTIYETYIHSFDLFKMNYSIAKKLYKKMGL